MSTTPTPTTRRPVRRLAAAIVLAVLTLATALGLTASPASAEPVNAPTMLTARGYATYARIYWMPPTKGDADSYTVERWQTGKVGTDKVWQVGDSRALTDTTVVEGIEYHYRVRANEDGIGGGPWSLSMSLKVNPLVDQLHKFSGDAKAFVTAQYQDLLGRNPGFGELNTTTLGLKNGTIDVTDVIGDLAADPARVDLRHPVIRLYLAYFDRAPDHGGLEYWLKKRAAGTKLEVASQSFANSSEFTNTYGKLDDTAFVTLVYQNVLDRTPEPGGLQYWVSRLEAKTITRGKLMTSFSESNEHKAKSRGRVQVADLHDDMLDKAMHPYSYGNWSAHVQGGGTQGELGAYFMGLVEYQP